MTVRVIEPLRLGWVIGIIEGEGWLGVRDGRPVVCVQMADKDVVDRLAEWTGIGNVTGPYRWREAEAGERKPTWKWAVTRRDDAAWLIAACAPYFGARRASRALEILDAFAAAGPTRGTAATCSYGHDISDDSPNLRLVTEGKYTKRRCLECQARRQREHRAREALRAAAVAG